MCKMLGKKFSVRPHKQAFQSVLPFNKYRVVTINICSMQNKDQLDIQNETEKYTYL